MRRRSRSLSAVLTLAALAFCSRHQLLLLYGDAVAHLHIARRLFDSREPGFRQLGSVWLPLPHLLLVPFVLKMSWWQSGVRGGDPLDGLLCGVVRRTLPAGALLCSAFDCVACGGVLRAESGTAVFLDHGDDRAAVPGGDDLGRAADHAAGAALGEQRCGGTRAPAAGCGAAAGVCGLHAL